LAHQWRQGDANGLEHTAGATRRVRPQQKTLRSLLDRHLLDAIEVVHDIGPFGRHLCTGQPLVKLLAQQQGEERTKQVAGDGGVGDDKPAASPGPSSATRAASISKCPWCGVARNRR
jgi:hypothetical protein